MPKTKFIVKPESLQWSEKFSYLLGLILADGYISDNRRSIDLTLQEQDFLLLEDISIFLYGYKKNLSIIPAQEKRFKDRIFQCQGARRLFIADKNFYSRIESLGLTNNKSFTAKLPEIPKEYFIPFLRGLIDGDGCISYFKKADSYCVTLITSVPCAESLLPLLQPYGFKLKYETKYSQPMCTLWLHGNRQCQKFLDILYKDSTIHLKRKYHKYLECKAENKHKDSGQAKKGYSWNKSLNKFVVRLVKNKKLLYCKYFFDEISAREAYLAARAKYY